MVLFVLAVVWAVYLAMWLRNRGVNRNVNSISSFNKQLSTLERTSPARHGLSALPGSPGKPAGSPAPGYSLMGPGNGLSAMAPMSRGQARRRRRDVLYVLGGLVAFTLVLAVFMGGTFFIGLQLLADIALVGYIGMLVRAQHLAQERQTKVRYIHPLAAQDAAGEVAYLPSASATAN